MIVIRLSNDKFLVLSEAMHVYIVDISIPACSCPHYIILRESGREEECKHIKEVRAKLRSGEIEELSIDKILYLLRKSIKK